MLDRENRTKEEALRSRLRRAVHSALLRLSRAARGRETFDSDEQLRACLALARLTPLALGESDSNPPIYSHINWTAQDERLLSELELARLNGKSERSAS